MTQRSSDPTHSPLVRPGARKVAYWLIAISVPIYGSFWLYDGLVAR